MSDSNATGEAQIEVIHIRRCRGNRLAWGAFVGPSNWIITTSLSLDRLVAQVSDRYPTARIEIAQ